MLPIILWEKEEEPVPSFLLQLSAELHLPIVSTIKNQNKEDEQKENAGHLLWQDSRLAYRPGSIKGIKEKFNPIYFDFIKYWKHHQRQKYSLRQEPLAKALGLKKNTTVTVWDLTAGTGKDAILILYWGARVLSFERSPVVAALLQDSIRLAQTAQELSLPRALKERFVFLPIDPRDGFPQEITPPEAIYLDPMYAPKLKKRKAVSRKEMRIFLEVVGNDPDSKDLFQWAARKGAKRVVVKRPLKGEDLFPNPTITFKGKSTRYDVYFITDNLLKVSLADSL